MRYAYLLFLLVLIFIDSCKTYRYIDVQILNPGIVKIPKKVDNLIVIYPTPIALDYPNALKSNSSIPIYQLVNNNFGIALKKNIEQTPVFELTNIIFPAVFSQDSINTIAKKDTTGRTLLLRFYYMMEIDTSEAGDSRTKQYDNGYLKSANLGCYSIYSRFQFTLDDITKNRRLDWHEWSDTFEWPKESKDDNASKAVIGASKQVAEKYVHRLAPYWSTEERMIYYAGNQLMRKGYNLLCENDLDGAVIFWKKLYNTGTKRLVALAAYNIALIYEIKDDFDECENWLEKSAQAKHYKETEDYLEKIRKRKLARLTIDQQFFE